MISVILIDSDLMFCQLLQKIISSQEIKIIGAAATGAKGIELVRQHQKTSPLVVLVNTQLSNMSGEAACLSIYRHWPHIRCIFLINTVHWPTLYRLIQSPAKGFVTKEACYFSLEAIRMVGMGRTYLQPDLALSLWDFRLQPIAEQFAKLSFRECEILNLIAKHKSYDEISDRLHISLKTIYNLKMSAFKKLSIESREQLFEILNQTAV